MKRLAKDDLSLTGMAESPAFKVPRTGLLEPCEETWQCPRCGNLNYQNRMFCNMRKCGAPRSEESWACTGCGNENYANRIFCNMKRCGLARPGLTAQALRTILVTHGAPENIVETLFVAMNNDIKTPKPLAPAPVPLPNLHFPPTSATFVGRGAVGGGGGDGAIGAAEEWTCGSCGNRNFAGRSVCNMRKCGQPRPGREVNSGRGPLQQPRPALTGEPPAGSWVCTACNNVNFPNRQECNGRNCGLPRLAADGGEPLAKPMNQVANSQAEVPEGSWICPSCSNVNWPKRLSCNARQCGAPRPEGV